MLGYHQIHAVHKHNFTAGKCRHRKPSTRLAMLVPSILDNGGQLEKEMSHRRSYSMRTSVPLYLNLYYVSCLLNFSSYLCCVKVEMTSRILWDNNNVIVICIYWQHKIFTQQNPLNAIYQTFESLHVGQHNKVLIYLCIQSSKLFFFCSELPFLYSNLLVLKVDFLCSL